MGIDPQNAGIVAAIVGGCGMILIYIILIIVVVILLRYHEKLKRSTQLKGNKDAHMYSSGQTAMSQLTLVNATSTLSFQSSDEHISERDSGHVSTNQLSSAAAEMFSSQSGHEDFQPIQISVSNASGA